MTTGARQLTGLSARIVTFVSQVAELEDVKTSVEANHDENRWWPTAVTDPRVRMAAAGWSSRVSYSMIGTYASVVAQADAIGFDALAAMPEDKLTDLLRPLGLPASRVGYLRSLAEFLDKRSSGLSGLLTADPATVISEFAAEVSLASFKVAQCAVLYSRGYHCGVIPVDSGMVTKLAPLLGITLPSGAIAHERMRVVLEDSARSWAPRYRQLITKLGYAVTLPADAVPSWWLHLVLIYFKRHYLNRLDPRVCTQRPACKKVIDCTHRA